MKKQCASRLPLQSGFTLIEVLIAILVLAFGLLGYAFLQTMTLRFAQSANQRTQATNLANAMFDQMRANRNGNVYKHYLNGGSDYNGAVSANDCQPTLGGNITEQFKNNWRCRLGKAMGDDAKAKVSEPEYGVINIQITWGDERWNSDANAQNLTFKFETRL
ncbi:type IV pilus modification protein PilV [Lysobacteraceae bacterium NML07-0707]|nr:type IV pilus modification protein PilV [Xanthomonadaceae bacterium NML07-0707]